MAVKIGSLIIQLAVEHGLLKSGLSVAEKEVNKTTKAIERQGRQIAEFGRNMALAVSLPMAAIAKSAVDGFVAQEKAMADVRAALASMGSASGKTADELLKTADALEMRSLVDADVILKQVTANLLTFGRISGQEFDRAQQAALDLSQRLGTDLTSATVMIGKALNDPVKGITAMSRAGIQFTEDQKAMIAGMVETGNVAGAQRIILAELERQFRGAAAAAADASPWRQAQVAIGQAMDAVGEVILPVVTKVADAVAKVAQMFLQLSPEMQRTIIVVAGVGAALGPVLIGLGALVQIGAPTIAMFVEMARAGGGLPLVFGKVALAATGAGLAIEALGLTFGQTMAALQGLIGGYAVYRGALFALTNASRAFAAVQIAVEAALWSTVRGAAGATSAKVALSGIVTTLTGGLRAMTAALLANPFTAAAAAVGVLAGAMFTLAERQRQARAETDNLTRSLKALAAARSEEFGAKRAELQVQLDQARDELTRLEIERDRAGRGATFMGPSRRSLNGRITEQARVVLGLANDLELADRAYKKAGEAAEAMQVPVAQTGAAAAAAGGKIKDLGKAAAEASDPLRDLIEKLYPESTTRGQMAELAFLDRSVARLEEIGISLAEARRRVLGIAGDAKISQGLFLDKPLDEVAKVEKAGEDMEALIRRAAERSGKQPVELLGMSLVNLRKLAETQTVQIAESFRDMADKSIQAIDRMASAIQGGGFLDILGSAVNLFLQLGSTGLFGSKLAANINAPRIPGNANGTAFHPGGLMMVGERGPEVLQVPRGGRVIPNHELRAAGEQAIRIILDERTDIVSARIDGRIGAASGALAEGGARLAQARIARRQTRRIG